MAIDVPSTISNDTNGAADGTSVHEQQNAALANMKHIYPVLGLFVFYILHDALQERMFRFDGFSFGFFMTLVEVLIMLIASSLLEYRKGRKIILGSSLKMSVLAKIGVVGLFLALAHGLGNTALRYSPYPLKVSYYAIFYTSAKRMIALTSLLYLLFQYNKVAFKSCKLVPTMALGACVTGHKYTALQYTAALVMGSGLAVLTAADVFTSTQNEKLKFVRNLDIAVGGSTSNGHDTNNLEYWALGPLLGPTLLTISTFFDSVVPNLQEQLLQTAKVKTSEMIFVSNAIMCLVLVCYTTYSRELMNALDYCIHNKDASGVLLLQGACAYLGLQCYLAIIRDHGGVMAVLLANGRKIATIVLSFMLFAKPFNSRHFVGLILVFVGVYLGYISKRGEKKQSKKISKKKKRMKGVDKHEHKV